MPRSGVGIFLNERTHSTPLDPKLMFWCISYNFGAFGTVWLTYETRCKTVVMVQKFVPRSRVGIFRNQRTRFTSLDSKLMFWCVSYNFGAFWTVWFLTKLGAKWAELVQKFALRSRIGIFCERTRSTLLDHKLTFWCVWYYLGEFGTVWLPYETRCKTVRTSAKVRATKSRRNFSQRTHPIHSIGP